MGLELNPPGRVFAAVKPPPDVVMALADRLTGVDVPGRRVPADNFHVTLRFVGEVEAVPYERWLAAMDTADKPPPFRVAMGGLGAFPKPARATVMWVGVRGEKLGQLAGVIDRCAADAGLGSEERPFRPHLTISRVRPPADVRHLVDGFAGKPDLSFPVTEFHIMAAVGSRYRVFETFPL